MSRIFAPASTESLLRRDEFCSENPKQYEPFN